MYYYENDLADGLDEYSRELHRLMDPMWDEMNRNGNYK